MPPWEKATVAPATSAPGCASCGAAAPSPAANAPAAGATQKAPSNGGTTGWFASAGVSGVGVSASVSIDSARNVYVTRGVGALAPGASVGVGRFTSKGSPESYFEGDSVCMSGGSPGAKLGAEGCFNDSGYSGGPTLGVGVSPWAAQVTTTTRILGKQDAALKSTGGASGTW